MAIYKMASGKEKLDKVDQTSFGKEGVLERWDLQRILRDQPDVLEEGLLIISEEFRDWQDSNRSIDLLGLDTKGRLVVVELKRGGTGEYMDLQAIRYAAMVANMETQHVVDTFQAYLAKRAGDEGKTADESAAETRIREHLGISNLDSEAIHTDIPRVILASEDFGKELTTCVMWLNHSWLLRVDREMEIKCVKLQPHRNGDEILIEASLAVPLPEAADYQVKLGKRQQETRESGTARAMITAGGGRFEERISEAGEGFQPGLKRLYETATLLEEQGCAQLHTYVNGKGNFVQVQLWLPGGSEYLASFNNLLFAGGIGEISIGDGWKNLGLELNNRMDALIGPATSSSGVRLRRLSTARTKADLDDILDAICEAYQKLKGSPSD